jgi:hypothetical protein
MEDQQDLLELAEELTDRGRPDNLDSIADLVKTI